ncbi:MAG TPA: BON domain-containing protein [Casimicrobiaceae bacterium]|jgi:osmotically-inducible protein OsmY
MKAKWATTCFVAGALLVPIAGYTADTKEPSKTESAKEVVADSVITTKIKAEFANDKQVSAMNIKVETDKGVVKLSGNAKSKDEADKAASIAKNTKGVVSVKNDIQVSASAMK